MKTSTLTERLRRVLSIGELRTASNDSKDELLIELETELTLLREENARLKVEQHRPADAGRIIERMRHLGQSAHAETPPESGRATDTTDFDELLAVRDALVDACSSVQRSMHAIRARLSELSAGIDRAPDRAQTKRPGGIPNSAATELDLALAVGSSRASETPRDAARLGSETALAERPS